VPTGPPCVLVMREFDGRGTCHDPLGGRSWPTDQRRTCRLVRCIQLRYAWGNQKNWPCEPVLLRAGDTNLRMGWPSWRHSETVSKMIFTEAEAN
jgi:hypothetical protein